jgi:hypothetical protein
LICTRKGDSELHLDVDDTGVIHLDIARHTEVNDVAAQLGIDHGAQQLRDFLNSGRTNRSGHDHILTVRAVFMRGRAR